MPADLPLRGVALYNPRLLSRDELVEGFVVRTSPLDRIARDLEGAGASRRVPHRLIIGQRGMGKTTLLHRLRFRVQDTPALDACWLPLDFPEEQYNVDRLSAFWLNCLDALVDTLEARGERVEHLDQAIEGLHGIPEPRRAEAALTLLVGQASARGKRLLLLVDNVDLVLERLKGEEWALREVLSHEPQLVLVGASARVIESTYQFGAAFYEFFEVDELRGLGPEETRTLICHLARQRGTPEVERLVREHPERIEPLRLLSGGNPRTLALLYTILAQGTGGDPRSDLEQLLDRCTPLYKARFEDLSLQAQKIVHTLAVAWHPVGSADLAARTLDLSPRTVSGQLERLVKDGLVQKVPLATDQGRSRKLGYQIAERFFNIWYLMRASRRVRRRLVWLVEFLRLMHTPGERRRHGRVHLERSSRGLRHAETALALAQAVDDPALQGALEHRGLRTLLDDSSLRASLGELLDLNGEDATLKTRTERLMLLTEAHQAILSAEVEWGQGSPAEFWELLGGSISLTPQKKHQIGTSWAMLRQAQRDELFRFFRQESARLGDLLGDAPWQALQRAFREGFLDDPAVGQVQGALEAAEAWRDDTVVWAFVGLGDPGLLKQAAGSGDLHAFLAREPSAAPLWRRLAAHYHQVFPLSERTEHAYREAIRLDPSDALPWNNLGTLLTDHLQRHEEAEEAYREAIRLDPSDALPWNSLAWHLHLHGAPTDALDAAQRAAQLDPGNLYTAHTLACCLLATGRWPEAVAPMRRFVVEGEQDYHEQIWPDILHFFALVHRRGHAAEAVRLLDDWGVAERWLPLRTALQAAAVGDREVLLSVAPEVRQPAEALLDRLLQRE